MRIEDYITDEISLKLVKKAEEFARNFFEREGTHGFSHVKRVFNLCMHIVEDHAKEGAKIARRFLTSLKYPKVDEVVHAIEAHRFSRPPDPRTLEAKILSDADKLDAIGAIGVARVFMYSGEHGRDIEFSIKHFEEKILKLRDLVYTHTAKKLAEERHKFVEEFVDRLVREIEGEL